MPVASVSSLLMQRHNYVAASQGPVAGCDRVFVDSNESRERGDSSSRRMVAEGF
jgi:hypothetical protein